MNPGELAKQLKAKFDDIIAEPVEFRGEFTLKLADAERIVEVCALAKKELGFDRPKHLRVLQESEIEGREHQDDSDVHH